MKKLGVDPTVDFAFRKLFGDPRNSDILIDLLNSVLQTVAPITSVEVLNPFLDKAYADDKLSILDIKARDEAGRWINVEMQTTISSALRNRLVYYTSALYSSQLLEGESYTTLTPAICICFLSRVLFPSEQKGHLTFFLREQILPIQLTDDFQIHTIELPKYNVRELFILPSEVKLSRWAWFMNNASEKSAEELRNQLPTGPMHKAVGVLERISQSPHDLHIYQSRQKAIRDQQSFIPDMIATFEAEKKVAIAAAVEEAVAAAVEAAVATAVEAAVEAAKREAVREGEQRGELIGQIIALSRIFQITTPPHAELLDLPIEQLTKILDELNRGSRTVG